jgi:hypothetical protein
MRKHLFGIFSLFVLASAGTAQSNYALSFSPATNKSVMVPYVETLAPTGALTVEAWMYAETFSGSPSIISKTETGGYAIYAVSGFLCFDIRLNGQYRTVSTSGDALLNAWHHVAATSDGRYVRLYVDGTLKSTFDAGSTYPIQYAYNNALIFGAEASNANNTGGSHFSGALDEIRIWNTERSYAEINSGMSTTMSGNESGLIGYWNFDEGSGTVANDLTANGNDGTLLNSPAWISSGVTLPVELVSFTAASSDKGAELRWRTVTEVNNQGFEIQRSEMSASDRTLGGDGHFEWSNAGFVEGNGTSNIPHEYLFTDRSVSAGTYSYRLKQIDRDGKFNYSQEAVVTIGAVPKIFALEQNYPNPFNPATTIGFTLQVSGFTTLKIYDALGRHAATLVNGVKEQGPHTVQFNAEGLASGIYFYHLRTGEYTEVKKMHLLR